MNDYKIKSGDYCDACNKEAEDWPGELGVAMKTNYGSYVVYCKTCFKRWLDSEDDMEIEIANWPEDF
jgi:hypothetical protein